jgi:hypothetical protein
MLVYLQDYLFKGHFSDNNSHNGGEKGMFLANVFLVPVLSSCCRNLTQVRSGDVHQIVLKRLAFLISSSLVSTATPRPIKSL